MFVLNVTNETRQRKMGMLSCFNGKYEKIKVINKLKCISFVKVFIAYVVFKIRG